MRLRPAVLIGAALLALPLASRAADTQRVALIATDAATGAVVEDLTAADIAVLENGERREVLGLERDARPLALAIVLDSSEAVRTQYRLNVVEAVANFLSTLPPKTRFTVWTSGDRPQRIYEQGDKRPAQEALLKVFTIGGNTLLDALVEAAQRLQREGGRRRAIVAISGSGPGYASWTPSECVKRVRGAQALVLGIIFHEGESAPVTVQEGHGAAVEATRVGFGEYQNVLNGLARTTGGRLESLASATGLPTALATCSRELQGQYRLVYATVRDKGPRNVQVRVTRPNVRSRVVVDSP